MPIYRFICGSCAYEQKKLAVSSVVGIACPQCNHQMHRSIGVPEPIPMETTDGYRKKSRFQDTESKRLQKAKDHFDKVGVKEMIQKDPGYAKRRGWIKSENIPK